VRIRYGVVMLVCLLDLLRPAAARAQTDERREVLAVVQRLFDAMRTRDSATMRSVFDPAGRLVSIRVRQGHARRFGT